MSGNTSTQPCPACHPCWGGIDNPPAEVLTLLTFYFRQSHSAVGLSMTDFYLEHIYNPETSSAPGPHQQMHSPGYTSAGPPHLPTRVAAGPSPAVLHVMVTRPTQPQVTPREAFACPHPPCDRRPAT